MSDESTVRREHESAEEVRRYTAALAKARGPKMNRAVEDLCQLAAEMRGGLRWCHDELARLNAENAGLRGDVAALQRRGTSESSAPTAGVGDGRRGT